MIRNEKNEKKNKFWIFAFRDHLASIQTFTGCIETADVYGDGDYKLFIADASKRLKVFAGTSLSMELRLPGVPSSLTTFYADNIDGMKRPVVAVACGPHVYMFRNLKPLYRYTLPLVELDEAEISLWNSLRNDEISIQEAVDKLEELRANGIDLSTRSCDLLSTREQRTRESFVELAKINPLEQATVITCMSSLWIDDLEDRSRSCLVLGTETQHLYILKGSGTEVYLRIKLASVPVCILTAGTLRVDYRIIVACRDGCIYSVKNGKLSSSVIYSDGPIVQIARYDNLVVAATTQNTLSFYKLRGKRELCIFLPCPATNITVLPDSVTGKARGVIVALCNGLIRVYVGKSVVHESQVYGKVSAMFFGQYGREEATLLIVLQNGSLVVEVLHRKASFDSDKATNSGPPAEQDVPIPIPHLTSVFVAQAERERSYSLDMYRVFQRDLTKTRLNTAKAFLNMISSGGGTMVASSTEMAAVAPRLSTSCVRMVTAVQGLGPLFKIRVTLQNNSKDPVHNLSIAVTWPTSCCKVPNPVVPVPFLLPSTLACYDILVERVTDSIMDEGVRLCVVSSTNSMVLASTTVELPDVDDVEGAL
ncbi:putative Ciliary BBSome complex subunit 1 [Trypanosoma vivax]|nr:putative Bardet-Biedl syndrome 1 protein [Trypanosoma vivax]KAH8604208.1 putative Ciliary BBSome complex subunit 1 [Trypanosoma vivax]